MEKIDRPACPRCGERAKVDTKRGRYGGAALLCFLLGFVLLFPFLFVPFFAVAAYRATGYYCRACRYSW